MAGCISYAVNSIQQNSKTGQSIHRPYPTNSSAMIVMIASGRAEGRESNGFGLRFISSPPVP